MFKTEGGSLNGIVYHPSEYLLTISGGTVTIYNIDLNNLKKITKVMTDPFLMNGDGLLLTDKDKLIVVQNGGCGKIYELTSIDFYILPKIICLKVLTILPEAVSQKSRPE